MVHGRLGFVKGEKMVFDDDEKFNRYNALHLLNFSSSSNNQPSLSTRAVPTHDIRCRYPPPAHAQVGAKSSIQPIHRPPPQRHCQPSLTAHMPPNREPPEKGQFQPL